MHTNAEGIAMPKRGSLLMAVLVEIALSSTAWGLISVQPAPDLIYDSSTGNITIDSDGFVSGIGRSRAMLPPGLLTTDNDTEIGGVGFNPTPAVNNLGNVAPPGLEFGILLGDLFPTTISAGLGQPNISLGLICLGCGLPNTPPVAMDAAVNYLPGTTVHHQFQATDVEDDSTGTSLVWSDLVFNSGPGGATPANTPTLSTDGAFQWSHEAGPVGDPLGLYSWTATVTDSGGLSDTATLRVDVAIPEPASALLIGLAVACLAFIRRR